MLAELFAVDLKTWLQLATPILVAIVAIIGSRKLEHVKQELSSTLAARTRRADYLRDQLKNLYGPLAFIVESNARLATTNAEIMKAYGEYFQNRYGPEYTDDMTNAIGTANRYGELIVANNAEALKLLRTQWGWLDVDDIEIASQFISDVSRHNVEFTEGKKLPVEFYTTGRVGTPIIHRGDFAQRVVQKLKDKQSELSGLTLVNDGPRQLPPKK